MAARPELRRGFWMERGKSMAFGSEMSYTFKYICLNMLDLSCNSNENRLFPGRCFDFRYINYQLYSYLLGALAMKHSGLLTCCIWRIWALRGNKLGPATMEFSHSNMGHIWAPYCEWLVIFEIWNQPFFRVYHFEPFPTGPRKDVKLRKSSSQSQLRRSLPIWHWVKTYGASSLCGYSHP